MDADKLRTLQIAAEARKRRSWAAGTVFVGVALLCLAAAYLAWPRKEDQRRLFGGNKTKAAHPAGLPATNAAAGREGVVLTVSGYIVNRERIELSPRFLGLVQWIGVKKGDRVTNGQVLVRLDDAEQKARLHEAQAQLANAQVALEKAQLDYQRMQKLIAERIETRQNEDDLRLRVAAARAAVRQAEAQVELMQTHLDWTVIRSPMDGVVLEKLCDANELVTPQSFGGTRGPSTALVAIADPTDLQVEVELNESDLAKVFLGQPCRVSPEAWPDKTYEGYVAEMAPEANRQKGTLQIKVQVRNPDRYLVPELSAKVDFLAR